MESESETVSTSTSSYEESIYEEPIVHMSRDPNNPRTTHFQDVSAAAYKIKGAVLRTPCTVSS